MRRFVQLGKVCMVEGIFQDHVKRSEEKVKTVFIMLT
jgi:hypothetical protein